jgi:hypothetical protein
MGTKKSHEYITVTATATTPSWTNKQVAMFNYFNPNGAYAKWSAMCDTIRDYVDCGAIPSGWHVAYGSLSCTYADNLMAIAMGSRVNAISLYVTLKLLAETTERGYNVLATELAGGLIWAP